MTSTTRTAGAAPPAETIVAVPVRHPGRWVAAVVVLLLAAALVQSLATNPNLDWATVGEYLFKDLTLRGIWVTVYLTVAAMVIGVLGGIVVAVMRLSDNPVLAGIAGVFVWVFRGTPLLVQIIFWGFLGAFYPNLSFGIPFGGPTFWSAPTSEIVRAGVLSVDHGQTEAAHSLGMPPNLTMRRIVLPQAMRVIVPPMGNETITMLKSTALVSVISGQDLLTNLQTVYSQNFKVIPLLVVASIWYLVLVSLLSIPQARLERRYGRGVVRSPRAGGAFGRLVGSWRRTPAAGGDAR